LRKKGRTIEQEVGEKKGLAWRKKNRTKERWSQSTEGENAVKGVKAKTENPRVREQDQKGDTEVGSKGTGVLGQGSSGAKQGKKRGKEKPTRFWDEKKQKTGGQRAENPLRGGFERTKRE